MPHENQKTLHLTLTKVWFDVMVTGEKTKEFRSNSKWMRSRLYNKDGTKKQYDNIKFVNGYGYDKPYFLCDYSGFSVQIENHCRLGVYSNGLTVGTSYKDDFIIYCGSIFHKGNIN